jgi:hypothetical protein
MKKVISLVLCFAVPCFAQEADGGTLLVEVDAGGDNMTVTYNYVGFNTFNVSHDFFQPNHRVIVFDTGLSRFNKGAAPFRRSGLGIF